MNVRGEEPHLVAYLIFDTFMLCIVILGLLILSDFDELYKIFVKVMETVSQLFGCRNWILLKLTQVNIESRIETIICIERRTTDACMLSIVVRELHERQQFGSIVLLIITINTKVLLDGLIHFLSLAVGLRMESSR